jgi:NADH:ubiquinone oxidoreductase subunit 2 (subunit N)
MTAPVIWIALPLAVAAIVLFLPRWRWVAWSGSLSSLLFSVLALALPADTALRILGFSIRIDSTLTLFGRQVSLTPADQVVLALAYAIGAFWFFGAQASGNARSVVPSGLAIIALLVASLAVTPFLYAALFIQIALLLAVPMLALPNRPPARGLLRFLIYQTLATPFILLAGFLLSGVDAGPGDLFLLRQASIFLMIGFAFLLSIFPLYTWIPMLAEEASPYALGFVLAVLPTFGLLFGLNFIDRYSWLREAPELASVLRLVGLVMMASSGVFAAFQRHLGRMMSYAAVGETGLALVALSLADQFAGLQAVFYAIVPRALALGVWAVALSILAGQAASLRYVDLKGYLRRFPVVSAAIVLAHLSLTGVPLLAGFPVRQAIWENLASESLASAFWFGVASLGLWIGALRTLAVLSMSPAEAGWQFGESLFQRILLILGLAGLFLIGFFPYWSEPLFANLPGMFEHLGK